MMYYGHGTGAAWGMIVFAVVLPLLILAAGGLLFMQIRRAPAPPATHSTSTEAQRILADRFARGEIDAEEYEGRMSVLRATASG